MTSTTGRLGLWLNYLCRILVFVALAVGCSGGGGGSSEDIAANGGKLENGSATGGERNIVCQTGLSSGEVQRPEFVMNLAGQTSWYASPVVADLDGDGANELIAAYYSVYVFGSHVCLRGDGGGLEPGWIAGIAVYHLR
jgi:hypothetical protein